MAQKSFYLVRRKDRLTNGKPTYYARFRTADGDLMAWQSTGETAKTRAELWALSRFHERGERRASMMVAEYATDFWSAESPFAVGRRAHGYSLSAGYLQIAEGYTRNHLLPQWGDSRLTDLTPGRLDKWIVRLARETDLAPATINKLLQTLRTILSQAVAEGYIAENPAAFVKPIREARRARGVLSPEELARLFSTPYAWADFRHYVLNLLAAVSGMRMGEVRGLLVENVKADHIRVRHSWEEGFGLKPPKYNSVRDVPLPERVSAAVAEVIASTGADSVVFYGGRDKARPMSKSVIEKQFYRALAAIGISEDQRLARGIVFHSHRHTLNTLLRSRGIPDSKVRQITGHRSEAMSDAYTHFGRADYDDVLAVQRATFGGTS